MRIRITNLAAVNSGKENTSYIVNSPDQCKDDTDRSAYESAKQLRDVVIMGKTIAEPMA